MNFIGKELVKPVLGINKRLPAINLLAVFNVDYADLTYTCPIWVCGFYVYCIECCHRGSVYRKMDTFVVIIQLLSL